MPMEPEEYWAAQQKFRHMEKPALKEWRVLKPIISSRIFDILNLGILLYFLHQLAYREMPLIERMSENLFIALAPIMVNSIWCFGRIPHVHMYRIDSNGVESLTWLWEPLWGPRVLQILGALVSLLALLLTIQTGSILLLIGTLLFTIMAGISIFCRPPPRVYRGRPRWENYDLIIVDRSRHSIFLRSIMNPISALQIHPPKKEIMSVAKLIHEQIPKIELKEGKWKGIY